MVIQVTATLIIETDPEPLLILGERDLERFALGQGGLQSWSLSLKKQRVGLRWVGRESELLHVYLGGGRLRAAGTGDVLPRIVPVAAVDAAASPNAHGVSFADAAFDIQRVLRPT